MQIQRTLNFTTNVLELYIHATFLSYMFLHPKQGNVIIDHIEVSGKSISFMNCYHRYSLFLQIKSILVAFTFYSQLLFFHNFFIIIIFYIYLPPHPF